VCVCERERERERNEVDECGCPRGFLLLSLFLPPDGLCLEFARSFLLFCINSKKSLILRARCFDFVKTAHIHTRESIFESILFFDVAIAGLGHY